MRGVQTVILAGGKGTRLEPLTRDRAKPAVPFGGLYRIVDFTLSNCINSGLRRILVITQYKARSLDRHIASGWSFLSRELGEHIVRHQCERLRRHGAGDRAWQPPCRELRRRGREHHRRIAEEHAPAARRLRGRQPDRADRGRELGERHVDVGPRGFVAALEMHGAHHLGLLAVAHHADLRLAIGGKVDNKEAADTLIELLIGAAEAHDAELDGRRSVNEGLFPRGVSRWAYEHGVELVNAAIDLGGGLEAGR